MPVQYPFPHPHLVFEMTPAAWAGRGRPIPSPELYAGCSVRFGHDGDYEKYRAGVEQALAANKRSKRSAEAEDVPPVEAAALAAATDERPNVAPSPFADMPHRRPQAAQPMEGLSVRVKEGINRRLDRYRIECQHGTSKQDIVSDVLDAFLRSKGF